MSQGLVYRYDVTKAQDGVGGEEGTFCLCTLWYEVLCGDFMSYSLKILSEYRTIEAAARAGEWDKSLLVRAIAMFEVR